MRRSTPSSLLEVKQLHTGFMVKNVLYHAVEDVSFTIPAGKVVCIVGESGCGKSVLSLSIMNLLPKGVGTITDGEILLDGRNLVPLDDAEMNRIRGKEIAMVFQEPMTALNPVFTIGFQIKEILLNHQNISTREAKERTIQLLKQVGISRAETIIDEYPHQLSGGMRQRVMIAMAIACQPKLLIADEPTTALDVTIQAQILELLKDVQQQSDMSIMLITHDLGVVAEMADEVIVMYAGQIVEQASVDDIFYHPKHPYLRQLLSSIPRLDDERKRLDSIEGIVPSLANMPRMGCRFAERCLEATAACQQISPALAEVASRHYARCLLYPESQPPNGLEVES